MTKPLRIELLRTYRPPRYPRAGYRIPVEVDRRFWRGVGAPGLVRLLAAVSAPLAFVACAEAEVPTSGVVTSVQYLSEAEVRLAVAERFSKRGIDLHMDVPFERAGVAFDADGFDASRRIGYEYRAHEGAEWHDALPQALSDAEASAVASWAEAGGPYFLVLSDRDHSFERYGSDGTRDEMLAKLEGEIDEFLAFLSRQGVI